MDFSDIAQDSTTNILAPERAGHSLVPSPLNQSIFSETLGPQTKETASHSFVPSPVNQSTLSDTQLDSIDRMMTQLDSLIEDEKLPMEKVADDQAASRASPPIQSFRVAEKVKIQNMTGNQPKGVESPSKRRITPLHIGILLPQ